MRIDEILDSDENTVPVQEGLPTWLISNGTKLSKWGTKQVNAARPIANGKNQPALDAITKIQKELANRPHIIKPKIKLKIPKNPPLTPDEIIIQKLNQRIKDLEAKRISSKLTKWISKDRDVGDTLIKIGIGGSSLIAANKFLDSEENDDQ